MWQPAKAASSTNRRLTVDRIFNSSEFKVESYGAIVWRKNGEGYYRFEDAKGNGGGRDLVRYDLAAGTKEIVVPAQAFFPSGDDKPLAIDGFELSGNESKLLIYTNSKKVWRQRSRGDYWVLDITSRALHQLGGGAPPSSLQFAAFSPDGSKVAYVRAHNLYVQDLDTFRITALTTNGSPTLINGTFDWVYEEELDLRNGYRWSPDSRQLAYWQLNTSAEKMFYLINDTGGLYPRLKPIPYPLAGEANATARIGVVSASGGPTHWLRLPGDPHAYYLARMNWASNSTQLVVQQFDRLQNTNLLLLANARTGQSTPVMTETDAAWVDNDNPFRWMEQGRDLVWLSERDGWRHAYRVPLDGGTPSLITKGNYDVTSIDAIDDKDGWLYFTASPHNPTRRYLYRVRLTGGQAERVTPHGHPGVHSYNISPDCQWAIHTWSDFTHPPVTELIRLPDYKIVRILEDNKKVCQNLAALKRPLSEFFRVDIGHGVRLDGWCLKPPGFDISRKYPVLFYVYGEPAAQTVMDSWHNEWGLWHWMLAQQGYIVMSVDNRGTPAPRGRAWRKSIFHRIGRLNAADQAAAVGVLLKSRPYLDPARVGVWGWSGGGSSTLNAMLQHPKLYRTGMAVAPVVNLRLYDSIYEERYMGLPQDNPDAYRLGSPLTYASRLKGHLLIVHGTGDDNVHYQGTEELINDFITYNKSFTMMAYPNRTHAINEGKNTTRHLCELLTRFLHQNLPARARP